MQGKMHRIRSLTPLQAAGNALAMHVQLFTAKARIRVHEVDLSELELETESNET